MPPEPSGSAPPPPHFIEVFPESFSPEQCEDIIARFHADPRRHPSRTQRGVNEKLRSGTMLDIAEHDDWADIRQLIEAVSYRNIEVYVKKYPSLQRIAQRDRSFLSPPLLEMIEPGQGYDYHIDAGPAGTQDRFISGIIYLRTIENEGTTDFVFQQVRAQPVQGMMVLFPPFWTHLHRGAPVGAGQKYNITNYLVLKPEHLG